MNWTKVVQLTLVHVGVAITVVPINSTLNRIMIADLHFSSALVGFLISLPYLLSPLQVMIGAWADRQPLWGRHRAPWMLLGGLMAAGGSYLTPQAVHWMAESFTPGLLASVLAFLVWGMGVNIASVSYLSLISDLSEGQEHWRSRTISVMWTGMILFIILTSETLRRLLEPYSLAALYRAFGLIAFLAVVFVLVGALFIEPARPRQRAGRERKDLLASLRLVFAQPTAWRFFVYLVLILIGIYGQDVLLEPFGAQVLDMSVGQTSGLARIWGTGVLITLLIGAPLVQRLGKKSAANLGALVAALGFTLIILAGQLQMINFFLGSVFLLGLGGGLMTTSNLSFMLDMTIPNAAGLYMGAWGVADFVGRAIGNIASGFLRDFMLYWTENLTLAYAAVFALEILGLIVALWLFRHISVQEFQDEAKVRLQHSLALAGD